MVSTTSADALTSCTSRQLGSLLRLAQLLAFAALLGACGGVVDPANEQGGANGPSGSDAGETGDPSPTGGLPCAVEKVLRERCQECHGATPTFGAPMPLVRYEDLVAASPTKPGKQVFEEVRARVHDDVKPMPEPPAPRLTANALATIDGWVAAGAPRGETCSAPIEEAMGCTPDVRARPTAKYKQRAVAGDAYMCYGFELPAGARRHATALRVKVDNDKIVRRVRVMQTDLPQLTVPFACPESALSTGRLVYAWAPGTPPLTLPPEAGLPVDEKTHWVVQVHYSNPKALAGETDESGFELCTTDKLRANEADVLAFGATKFELPARSKVDLSCTQPALPQPIRVLAGAPYMHGLGYSMSTTLTKKDGTRFDLGSNPMVVGFAPVTVPGSPGAVVEPGDTIVSRCVWGNDSIRTVRSGTAAEDEACLSFAVYYPKIPAFSALSPATASVCAPTPSK